MSEITQLKDKAVERAKLAEAQAKAAEERIKVEALSAVNTEKSWFKQNWRQLLGIVIAIAVAAFIVTRL